MSGTDQYGEYDRIRSAGLQTLCDQAPDGLVAFDQRGIILAANRTFLTEVGYQHSELAGKVAFSELVAADHKHYCAHLLAELKHGRAVGSSEIEWHRRDDTTFWARVNGRILPATPGTDLLGGISVQNLGNAPLIEETFDAQNRFSRMVLDSMGEGLLLLDRDLRILGTNRRFLEIHGTTADKVVGRHCHEVSHSSEVPCWQIPGGGHKCPVKKAIETGRPASEIHTHYDRKRGEHYVEVRAFPLKDEEDRVFQIIETHTDITEKRKLEERLRQSEKMESLGSLAGGIAHDLNNILTPIIGYSELELLRLPMTDPGHENLREINAAASRAVAMVQQILAFSRKQMLKKSALDLNLIITEIKALLQRSLRDGIELRLVLADNLRPIFADRTQIEQIIINLVVNARDAITAGGSIVIETGNSQGMAYPCQICGEKLSGNAVLLQVTDNGCGIPPDVLSHIFEPFFTTKKPGYGTGMGLSTIMGIIHQHEGHIKVTSTPGQGSTFKVYLPATDLKALSGCEPKKSGIGKTPGGDNGKILVVDDTPPVRNLIQRVLERKGYTTLSAEDGDQALEVFQAHPDEIRLVITDIVMPGLSGPELMAQVTALKPGTPVVFMSGYSEEISQDQFLLDTDVVFLQKPVSVADLLAVLQQQLK